MIENIIMFIGYLGIIGIYILGVIALMLLIQLVSYRVFGFNLYKWLMKNLLK